MEKKFALVMSCKELGFKNRIIKFYEKEAMRVYFEKYSDQFNKLGYAYYMKETIL